MPEDNQYFFVLPDDAKETDGTLILRNEEAHHCLRVLRKTAGDVFFAVNGRGREYRIRLKETIQDTVVCEILQADTSARELPWSLTLGIAMIKMDRFEWMLEKAVELGVTRIVPLKTVRSIPDAGVSRLQRWQKIILSALKQCRRAVLPEISSPARFNDFLSSPGEHRLIFHESAEMPLEKYANHYPLKSGDTITVLIGPEGGWTEEEILSARQYLWTALSLGPRRLRSETAALAAVGFFSFSASCKGL